MDDLLNQAIEQFISPIGVGILILVITNLLDKHDKAIEKKDSKVSLLDDLITSFNMASLSLETLRQDGEKIRFEFKNRDSAKRIASKLQSSQWRLNILGNRDLSKMINESIDDFRALSDDVDSLEVFFDNKNTDFSLKENQALDELRSLKLEALKIDLRITEDTKFESMNPDKRESKKKVQALESIFNSLNTKYLTLKEDLKNTEQFCKDRRVQLTIRIVDTQTKIRSLTSNLETLRGELISKKVWF